MDKMFKFPIGCSYKQRVFKKTVLKEGFFTSEDGRYVVVTVSASALESLKASGKCPVDLEDITEKDLEPIFYYAEKEYSTYEAFDSIDLISSIYSLVKDARKDQNRQAAAKRWIEKYGFLGCNIAPLGKLGGREGSPTYESLNDFWNEAEALADLWDKYKQLTQRDILALKKWIRFIGRPSLADEIPLFFYWGASEEYLTKAEFAPFSPPNTIAQNIEDCYFDKPLSYIQDNPIEFYKSAGIGYISTRIELKLSGLRIASTGWDMSEKKSKDYFKTTPIIKCRNLLQAMYLQFFMLLSDEYIKICQACGQFFIANRSNQKYCETKGACKHTAKSRRYRERKAKAQIENN